MRAHTEWTKQIIGTLLTFVVVFLSGEVEFNSDILQELTSHSKTNQKTFAYYFTEKYQPPAANRAWALPDWAKVSADNADQVPFVWGYVYTKENPSVLQGIVKFIYLYMTIENIYRLSLSFS